ncbi:MAG TPA: response regulator [Puia sp.]|nr:response regulator [Puia sp.]
MSYKKILLVDDDIDDRFIFAELLRATGPELTLAVAENGLEMISVLEKMPDPELPDMIILDQNMPKMTGKESLIFLKANARYKDIQTIIYSTYQVKDFYRECLQLGAQDVVAKPDTMQAYREMIGRFLFHSADVHPDPVKAPGCGNE